MRGCKRRYPVSIPALFAALLAIVLPAVAPPPARAADVPRFGTHDVVLHSGRTYDGTRGTPNPFTDVTLSAEVVAPSGRRYRVEGFFDGNGAGGAVGDVFKVRVFADEAGNWSWRTESNLPALHGKSGGFSCGGTLPGRFAAGPVVIDPQRPRTFKLREGGPIFLLGKFLDVAAPQRIQFSHTMFSEELTEADREAMLARHLGMSLNKINVYLANRGDYAGVSTTPWVGSATQRDLRRFDLARWHLYERWLRRLRDAGLLAQLWFFADDSGFGDLPEEDRARLIRYGMARLSGYANTMFTLVLEWQEGWTEAEVRRLAAAVDDHNPWGRLLSAHGTTGDFSFPTAAWADYVDIQAGNEVGHAEVHRRGMHNRALAAKPLIQEEHGLGAEDTENRQRAWAAFASGAAGIGTGAFLRQLANFVHSVPFERLEPAPGLVASGTAYALAIPGQLYVAYLPQGGKVSLDLSRASSSLSVRWFDPRLGAFINSGVVQGGGVRSFTPPAAGDWALLLGSAGAASAAPGFHTVAPCRSVDTRAGLGTPARPLLPGERRQITLTGRCGVPAGARSVVANLTIIAAATAGHLEVWPGGEPPPGVSSLNFAPGRDRANNLLLTVAADGSVTAQAAGGGAAGVHLVVDLSGYFD